MLLNKGADVNAPGKSLTALPEASEEEYDQIRQMLLDEGADSRVPLPPGLEFRRLLLEDRELVSRMQLRLNGQ